MNTKGDVRQWNRIRHRYEQGKHATETAIQTGIKLEVVKEVYERLQAQGDVRFGVAPERRRSARAEQSRQNRITWAINYRVGRYGESIERAAEKLGYTPEDIEFLQEIEEL